MKEIDYLKGEMSDLEDKIAEEIEKEAADSIAQKMRILYDSMTKAGFTDSQAWWVVTACLKNCLNID